MSNETKNTRVITEEELEHLLYSINKHAKVLRDRKRELEDEGHQAAYDLLVEARGEVPEPDCHHPYDVTRFRWCYKCEMDFRFRKEMAESELDEDDWDDLKNRSCELMEPAMDLESEMNDLYAMKDEFLDRFLTPLCIHVDNHPELAGINREHCGSFLYYKTANRSFHRPIEYCYDDDLPTEMITGGRLFVSSEADTELMSVEDIRAVYGQIGNLEYSGGRFDEYPGDEQFLRQMGELMVDHAARAVVLPEGIDDMDGDVIWDMTTDMFEDSLLRLDMDAMTDELDGFGPWKQWRMSGRDADMFMTVREDVYGPSFYFEDGWGSVHRDQRLVELHGADLGEFYTQWCAENGVDPE